jgi:flagellar protein FliO/FliZ
MPNTSLSALLWFVAIIVMIPVVLWLLKRTPLGGAGSTGVMRTIAALPISPNQRLLTVEVGQGEDRRWLVLGVTPNGISTLHTMAPQAGPGGSAPGPTPSPAASTPFAQLLGKLRPPGGSR